MIPTLNKILVGLSLLLLLLPIGYSAIESIFPVYKYLLFGLTTVVSIGLIVRFIIVEEIKRGNTILNLIIAIIAGFISSQIIGEQTHDVKEGPMAALGMWIFVIGYFYTISFALFIYFLGRINNKVLSGISLIIWVIGVVWTGYFYDNTALDKLGENYDSMYFPSHSAFITPMLIVTVGLMCLLVLLINPVKEYLNKKYSA